MRVPLAFIALFAVIGSVCTAVAAPPPADGILDPLEIWPATSRKSLQTLRSNVLRERGFSLFFVAIGAPENMSADRMAQDVLYEWLPAGEGAVFLTLVDRPGLGIAITSGKKRPPEDAIEEIRMYLYSNRKTDSSAAVLESAANQLVSGLPIVATPAAQSSAKVWEWMPHLFEILSALGALLTIALGIYLMNVARHSNFFGFQKRFPVYRVKGRLGGANSGGYGVMIDFGGKPTKPVQPSETDY